MTGGPIRTCIGCRERAARDSLLRVVWDPASATVRLDPRRRLPGRGASLHPQQRCWELAVRRRALPRALRVPAIDGAQVAELWTEWVADRHAGRLG